MISYDVIILLLNALFMLGGDVSVSGLHFGASVLFDTWQVLDGGQYSLANVLRLVVSGDRLPSEFSLTESDDYISFERFLDVLRIQSVWCDKESECCWSLEDVRRYPGLGEYHVVSRLHLRYSLFEEVL